MEDNANNGVGKNGITKSYKNKNPEAYLTTVATRNTMHR
jgi:hypothetical protein